MRPVLNEIDGRIERKLSEDSSQGFLDSVAETIRSLSGGTWTEKLDGLDQS